LEAIVVATVPAKVEAGEAIALLCEAIALLCEAIALLCEAIGKSSSRSASSV
jgi:hypothetical protein